jgi:hypothetical protein
VTDARRAGDSGGGVGDVGDASTTRPDVAARHQQLDAATAAAAETTRPDVADRHERGGATTHTTRATSLRIAGGPTLVDIGVSVIAPAVSCRVCQPAAARHDRSARIAATRRARTAAVPERQRGSIESARGFADLAKRQPPLLPHRKTASSSTSFENSRAGSMLRTLTRSRMRIGRVLPRASVGVTR